MHHEHRLPEQVLKEDAMLTAIVLLLYLFVLLFDLLPGGKSRSRAELAVYWAALCISFCVLLLYSLDIKPPSLMAPIVALVRGMFPQFL